MLNSWYLNGYFPYNEKMYKSVFLPLSLDSKLIRKQDNIISHTFSLVNVAPSGAKVRVRKTCRILNNTTPSDDWSVPTNLACVTASAILWTVWGMDLCVGSVNKKMEICLTEWILIFENSNFIIKFRYFTSVFMADFYDEWTFIKSFNFSNFQC